MRGLPQTVHALPTDGERVFNDPPIAASIDHTGHADGGLLQRPGERSKSANRAGDLTNSLGRRGRLSAGADQQWCLRTAIP